jgi:hypothetical protein
VARVFPKVAGRVDPTRTPYPPPFLNPQRDIAEFLQRCVAGGFRIHSFHDTFPGSHRQMAANFLVHIRVHLSSPP